MERPTILLAVDGEIRELLEALDRAGFAATSRRPERPAAPDTSTLPSSTAIWVATSRHPLYAALQAAGARADPAPHRRRECELPDGLGGSIDELALKPMPADALVYPPPGPPHPQRAASSHRVGRVGVVRGTVAPRRSPARDTRQRLRPEGRRRQDDDRGQHGRRAAPADAYRGAPARRRRRRRAT